MSTRVLEGVGVSQRPTRSCPSLRSVMTTGTIMLVALLFHPNCTTIRNAAASASDRQASSRSRPRQWHRPQHQCRDCASHVSRRDWPRPASQQHCRPIGGTIVNVISAAGDPGAAVTAPIMAAIENVQSCPCNASPESNTGVVIVWVAFHHRRGLPIHPSPMMHSPLTGIETASLIQQAGRA